MLKLPAANVTGETLRNSLTNLPENAIDNIHEALWDRVQDRHDTPTEPLFYDMTTSYFEGTACPLAEYGYSSDKSPDKRQITFGVTVNPDRVPLQHDVYPGDKKQSDTSQTPPQTCSTVTCPALSFSSWTRVYNQSRPCGLAIR